MFRFINIFDIFQDYCMAMKKDLNCLPFFVILLLIPVLITLFLSWIIQDAVFKGFIKNLIIINTILVPLLINVLMILYYSIERTKNSEDPNLDTKLIFLKHLHVSLSMTILVSVFTLILSVLLDVVPLTGSYQFFDHTIYTILIWKCITFFLISFLFVNLLIIIRRIHLLINFEISEETSSAK
jgi:hypothetical protein